MTDLQRERHALLALAAIVAEAHNTRLDDSKFREYVRDITSMFDLPTAEKRAEHLKLVGGGA